LKLVQSSEGRGTVKFMQVLEGRIVRRLEKLAKERGIGVQELLRAIVIPEWVQNHDRVEDDRALAEAKRRKRRLRRWRKRGPQAC
jgi:hypothetical protein